MRSLVERLNAARQRQFVGRVNECVLFEAALATEELPFYVLHIFGPGGLGKTTLLREFTRIAEKAQIPVLQLDARNIEPSPESFLDAVQAAIIPDDVAIAATGSTPERITLLLSLLASQSGRHVFLIDTYELLGPLDDWLREQFFPQLPEDTLIALAGRFPPALAWRMDTGWQTLIHTIALRNLSPEESRTYLTKRAVPTLQHQSVVDFTHGHPLALSLVADVFAQGQNIRFQPEDAPDVVKTLVEKFVQEVPSQSHRSALEACALVRLTTEALLERMLDEPDVHELFEWLRGLSFIESGRLGLFPHDLAREVLTADLRWRNPDWYAELHLRARTYYTTRLQQTQGQEQHRVLFDYIFLHRDNPDVKPYFTWQETSSLVTDTLRPADRDVLVRMVTAHEGAESASLVAYWLERQPQSVLVFRDGQLIAGFVMLLALHQVDSTDRDTDPAVRAASQYLHEYAPLRPGEGATLFRFWMAHDTYQAVSTTQSLIFISFIQHQRNTPGLAFTFFSCAQPDFWAAMFAYADLARITEADFTIGGRYYGIYGHDWRVVPPVAWQELLAQREIAASVQAATPQSSPQQVTVLSQPSFLEAVRDALRNFSRPDALLSNPLLHSRLVVETCSPRASSPERVSALQALLKEAAELLQASPREAKCYRALHHTYLHPAPTQEQAAELLDLPFSTFRRHLKAGMIRVSEILWHREIGGLES